ncbi:MAG: YfaZ family outer membrane protein [Sulfuricurvum sp.]|uniref:YfaZ family outer membrane protein n=1 Tax=Sulfuricurvum sp. TaxID=2025608 RepID=UPI0026102CF3|nr:YfaZ family outer membrane protein [Sulfuricurvum sp.]MDD2828620.1 YfaZ family outer membrane protein [Sulfuricurvum sp.]MDD4948297.1 YfaZ family outer membrane protein [Sulfuricurvum sp.]
MLKKIALTLLVSTALFAENHVGINVNEHDVGGDIRLDLGRMGYAINNAYIGARVLNGDKRNSDTINDTDPLLEASFMVMQSVRGVPELKVGFGVKTEYTKIDGSYYLAAPLGVEGELQLPLQLPFPTYMNGAFYYAPSALSFQDSDGYTEIRVGVDFEPIEHARIGFGYRSIDTDLIMRNVTYNDSWYFNMRLDF